MGITTIDGLSVVATMNEGNLGLDATAQRRELSEAGSEMAGSS
jgi:hypothetical protein